MENNIAIVSIPLEQWDQLNNKINRIESLLTEQNPLPQKELLTAKEVQEILKIGRTTFDRYVREGILHTTKISQKKGAKIYVERKELDNLLKHGII